MDPEAPLRKIAVEKLAKYFDVFEEVSLRTPDGISVRCDLLLVFKFYNSVKYIAIEIKSSPPKQAKHYRDTYIQALRYVNSTGSVGVYRDIKVNYAFIWQELGHEYIEIKRNCLSMDFAEQYFMMRGIDLAFNSLKVGYIKYAKGEFKFFGANNVLWSAGAGVSMEFREKLDL